MEFTNSQKYECCEFMIDKLKSNYSGLCYLFNEFDDFSYGMDIKFPELYKEIDKRLIAVNIGGFCWSYTNRESRIEFLETFKKQFEL